MRRIGMAVGIMVIATLVACGDDAGDQDSANIGEESRADASSVDDVGDRADSGKPPTRDGGPDDAGGPDDIHQPGDAQSPEDSSNPTDAGPTFESLHIYGDSLNPDWIDATWDATVDFSATGQVHTGTYAIGVEQAVEGALSLLHGDWGAAVDIDPADWEELSFEIYSTRTLELDVALQGDTTFERVNVGTIDANQWTTVRVPFDELAPDGNPFHRLNILEVTGEDVTYFVDEVQMIGQPIENPDAGHSADGGNPGSDSGDTGGTTPPPPSEFVTVDPNTPRFLVDGEPFYFAGTNLYWMVQYQSYGRDAVDDSFDMCEDMGLRVIRIWGFADGHDWTDPTDSAIMQPDAGVFNESTFQDLDYVLAEAEDHGVRVILPFVNYWDEYGGMLQYARWAGGNSREFFYTDLAARQLYKDYVDNMVNRVNTITGETYRDDPTIMAWELANEARADFDSDAENGVLEGWYEEMAAYVRSVDPNHLVATGGEGWEISDNNGQYYSGYSNTYAIRGAQGSSYVDNTALDDIDFGSAHLYPDVWGFSDAVDDGQNWIADHAEIARQQGKPFVLGEFGYDDRSVYEDWLQTIEDEDVAGSLLWQIVPHRRENDMTVYYPDDTDLVNLFTQHAQYMNSKGSTTP